MLLASGVPSGQTGAAEVYFPVQAPGMPRRTPEPISPDEPGYQVDDLTVDTGQHRVLRGAAEIPLPPLSFELLLALTRAAPSLVTFDQLTERVWTGLVITPETITQRVKLVRTALGDDPNAPRYIAGVRGMGYRMVAPVRPLGERRQREAATPYWQNDAAPVARLAPATSPASAAAPAATAQPVAAATAAPAAVQLTDLPTARSPGAVAWFGSALAILVLLALPWAATRYLRSSHVREPASVAAAAAMTSSLVVVQPPRTIAVLPLVDVTPGDGNAYLGEGLAQELSARLARVHGLRVASRTSSVAHKDADVRTIALTLGVRHILEGSVMRQGDQLRVTAQLVDAASGYDVWSQTYNRTWQDLIAIQDDLARSITGALKVVLNSDATQNNGSVPTTRVEAFDLYLAGLAKLHAPDSGSQLGAAGENFRQALAIDPNFALAWSGLCERYAGGYELTRDAGLVPQAEQACAQALRLDGTLREVSAALAHLYLVSGRDSQAAGLYRAAIRDDPGNADGYMGLGEALAGQRRTAEAEQAYRAAVEAEPTYWGAQNALANFLLQQGRAAQAIPLYRRATELVPASAKAWNNLGAAYLMTAAFSQAQATFEHSLMLDPTRSAYSNLGSVYYYLGRYADSVSMFSHATELAGEDHRVWGNLADARWQLAGEREQARLNYHHASELAHRSLGVNPRDALSWMQLAYYDARTGADAAQVRSSASHALELGGDDPYVHYYAALLALERQDASGAIEQLRHAVALGYDPRLIRAAPDFSNLRGDPRFKRLMERPTEGEPHA
ncbi:MAG: tetratricopeptide repeat protein [Proteobacteria bacterium]|nr:tetratricopeptide repeat protein [Pseudomonadota bacterium]